MLCHSDQPPALTLVDDTPLLEGTSSPRDLPITRNNSISF